jgi:endonuclease/exonuclease/phosphatase family metal-dependent hydrolase
MEPMMDKVIRAGTWNIHEGISAMGGIHLSTHTELISRLASADLDILALQEVPFEMDSESGLLRSISKQTNMHHVSVFPLSPSVFHQELRSGLALVSRSPHLAISRFLLPNPRLRSVRTGRKWMTWDKGMIIAKLRIHNVSLWACSVHGFPFHDFGRRADDDEFTLIWQALANAINQLSGSKIIVAGDFNTERRDLLTRLLKHRNIARAIDGTATHGNQSFDDILYDEGLARRSVSVMPSFSDHAFCQAEFSSPSDQP